MALKNNIDGINEDSIDSIDRLDQQNLGHVFALSEEFLKTSIHTFNKLRERINRKIIEFLSNHKESTFKSVVDGNDYYFRLR